LRNITRRFLLNLGMRLGVRGKLCGKRLTYLSSEDKLKIRVILRQARESAGLTQEILARRFKTKKTAISRIENHAEDIKLSTLERVATALGKHLEINIVSAA